MNSGLAGISRTALLNGNSKGEAINYEVRNSRFAECRQIDFV